MDSRSHLPNILLLVTDQFRNDIVSPIITPNLQEFEQSLGTTSFRRAYSSTPTCTPARAALLTGKSPWAHGMLGYDRYTDCAKYPTTLPRILEELGGYHTVAIGKNHFGPIKHLQGYQNETLYDGGPNYFDDYDQWFNETMPNQDPMATCGLGWNDWPSCPYEYEEYMHPSAWTTREAVATLEDYFANREGGEGYQRAEKEEEEVHRWIEHPPQPLLLKVSYHRPHSPYDPPRRILEQYLPGGTKSIVPQLNRFVNDSSWDVQYKNISMNRQDSWAGDPGVDIARHSRAGYLGSAEFVDENIGVLLNYLKTQNLWDNFMIVWTSDHGDQNGDHYLWRKGYPWEGSTHIRMVMKVPSSYPGGDHPPRINKGVVENRDLAPTLYDMVGVLEDVRTQDPLMNGQSLLPILTGEKSTVREWIDLEHGIVFTDTNHWNALVGYMTFKDVECDYWKFILIAFDASERLFCLSNDPNETYDLSTVIELDGILSAWRHRMVEQFEREGRGNEWVVNGILQPRTKQKIHGANFPCNEEERGEQQQKQ